MKNLEELRREKEILKYKIEVDEVKLSSDFKLLKAGFLENTLRYIFKAFLPKK